MKSTLLLAAAAILFVVLPSKADVTYTYAGDDFTTCFTADFPTAAPCTSFSLSGQFVVAAALAPNSTVNIANTLLENFSFTDGYLADYFATGDINGLPGGCPCFVNNFTVTTDSLGNIVAWNINASTFYNAADDRFSSVGTLNDQLSGDEISWLAPSTGPGTPGLSYYQSSNTDDQGTWSVTTPEPSTLLMLLAGIFIIGFWGFEPLWARHFCSGFGVASRYARLILPR